MKPSQIHSIDCPCGRCREIAALGDKAHTLSRMAVACAVAAILMTLSVPAARLLSAAWAALTETLSL